MTLSGIQAAGALLALAFFTKKKGTPLQAYRAGQPIDVELVAIDDKGHMLNAAAAADFVRMRETAARDGHAIIVESAFRTMEQQAELWLAYQRGERVDVAAPPGYSNHQSGDAADITTARGTNAVYFWLEKNAHLFNFKRTVGSEPWHWEHVA